MTDEMVGKGKRREITMMMVVVGGVCVCVGGGRVRTEMEYLSERLAHVSLSPTA